MKRSTRQPASLLSRRPTTRSAAIEPLEARIAPAVTVTVLNVDSLAVDNDNDGVADPGDRIHYTITVNNTGASDMLSVSLSEFLSSANLTLVGNSVNVSPLAFNDTYTAIGNTSLVVGTIGGVSGPAKTQAGSVIDNDTEFLNDSFVITSFQSTSAQGGTVSMVTTGANRGSFSYLPATGFTGTDSFSYTISDDGIDGVAGNADDLSCSGTVTVTVSEMVWYVNASAAAGGTGRSDAPFNSITAANLNGAGGSGDKDGPNDTIFLYAGSYSGGLALESGQKLIGQASGLTVAGVSLVAAGGARPTLSHNTGSTLALSSGNDVRGINFTNSAGNGITGTVIGTATLADFDVTVTGGSALSVTGSGTLTVTGTDNDLSATNGAALIVQNVAISSSGLTFKSISSVNGATNGITLDNTGTSASNGGLTVTGLDGGDLDSFPDAGSGGTISGKTGSDGIATSGTGIYLNKTRSVSLSGMAINNSQNYGIRGVEVTSFTLNDSTVGGTNGTSTAFREGSVILDNLSGSGSMARVTISGSIEDNFRLENSTGTLSSFNVSNSSFLNNSTVSGNIGFRVAGTGTATMTATVDNCFFQGNRTDAINGDAGDSSVVNLNVTNNTIVAGTGGNNQGNIGIDLSVGLNGTMNFHVDGNKVGTSDGTTAASLLNTGINIFNGSLATSGTRASISGTVKNNTVINDDAAASGVSNGFGIRLFNQGYGNMAANVQGNTISKVNTDYGLFVEVSSNSGAAALQGTTTVAVTNNTVNVKSGALDAIRVQSRGNSVMNARIENNTSSGGGTGFFGLTIRQAAQTIGGTPYQATFNLEGLATGLQTSFATITSYLSSKNAGITLANINEIHSQGITGVASISGVPALFFTPQASDTPTAVISTEPATTPATGDGNPAQPPVIIDDGTLSQAELDSLVNAAIARWEAAGLSPEQAARLHSVAFTVENLPGWYLGQAKDGVVTLDADAAGNAWFIDQTPFEDSEFAGAGTRMAATGAGGAQGRVDALTTIMHELGHQLGLDDTYGAGTEADLMHGYLGQGERRLPALHQADGAVPHAHSGPDFLFGSINVGTLPAGKTLTVVYDADINALSNGLAPVISSQVLVTGSNFVNVLSNDPGTAAPSDATVTPLDTLSLGSHVWNDTNHDGVFQSGTESGVNGVVMNLYVDSNGDGTYTPGTDALVATTTTAGGGLYSFTNLLPGEYIVQAAQSNFDAGKPLASLPQVTLGSSDPDDNVDNDNNGILLAGHGAVSKAITLAYNSEPTAGTGNDTNSTLDFGFVTVIADLQITKTNGATTAVPGTSVTYTIVVSNAGPNDASGATVADTFSAALSGVTWTAATAGGATGTLSGTGSLSELVNLPSGGSITYTVTGTILSGATGTLSNTATVTAPASVADLNLANNTATDSDTLTPQADLSLTKTGPSEAVIAGDTFTYTLHLSNAGASDAQNVILSDALPLGTTFVSASGPAGWNAITPAVGANGVVAFTKSAVAGAESGTFTILVKAGADLADSSSLSNTASVFSSTFDTDAANNSATVSTSILTRADLAVTKTNSPNPVIAGNNLTYTLNFSNSGASNAQGVSLSDVLPAGTTFVSASAPAGWNASTPAVGAGGTLTFSKGTVAAAESGVFTIVVNVGSDVAEGSLLSNTASVSSDTTDPNLANNAFTATASVSAQADLALVKSDLPDPVIAGNNLTYTLNLSNIGASNAQNVTLTDVLPAGTTFVSASSPGGWSASTPAVGASGIVTFTKSSVTAAETGAFTIVVKVGSDVADGVSLSNTASVASSTTDANPADNSATATSSVQARSDLSIVKTGPSTIVAGKDITYTITLTNNGPSDARDVLYSDLTPPGTTPVSVTQISGPSGTYLATGESQSYEVVVHVPAGAANNSVLTNTASVTSSTFDPISANNNSTVTTLVTQDADLSLTKTANVSSVIIGGTFVYTLTLTNNGASDAQNVSVSDQLPAGATFVSSSAPGDWNPLGSGSSVLFTKSTLAAGESATFTITALANDGTGGSTLINTATVSSSTPDSNSENNSSTVPVSVVGTDLSITQTNNLTTAATGATLTYSLSYSNAGYTKATGVVLKETLPAGTTFNAADNPGWSQVGSTNTYSFDVGSLAIGATGTATFVAHVNNTVAAGLDSISSTASISDDGASGADITPLNNTATDTDVLDAAPDLAVTLSLPAGPAKRGASLVYTLNYANNGTQDATGVLLTETLPANTTFNSASSSGGWSETAPGSGVYTFAIGSLAAGGSGSALFVVDVNAALSAGTRSIANLASIDDDHANGTDPDSDDNSASLKSPVYNGILAISQGGNPPGTPDTNPITVEVFDVGATNDALVFRPYAGKIAGGVRVAVGDFNGDGFDDVVTGRTVGHGNVRVFDGLTGTRLSFGGLAQFDFASSSATNGVFVAAGDLTGDGRDDLIVGESRGGGRVVVIDGVSGALTETLKPFGGAFHGGVRVAAGDFNSDKHDDLVVTQQGQGTTVKVFDGTSLSGINASSPTLLTFAGGGGTRIATAVGDVNADGTPDLITGTNLRTGSPDVIQVHSGTDGSLISSVAPFGGSFFKGIRVGAVDLDLDGFVDIIAAAGPGGKSRLEVYSGQTGALLSSINAFPPSVPLGLFVAGSVPMPFQTEK